MDEKKENKKPEMTKFQDGSIGGALAVAVVIMQIIHQGKLFGGDGLWLLVYAGGLLEVCFAALGVMLVFTLGEKLWNMISGDLLSGDGIGWTIARVAAFLVCIWLFAILVQVIMK